MADALQMTQGGGVPPNPTNTDASQTQSTEDMENQVTAYQDLVKATLQYNNDMNKADNELNAENATKIAQQIAAMNNALSSADIQNALESVRGAAKDYKTAVQLQKTGEYVSDVQSELLGRNKRILANLSADTMTAKRVATINQQNAIRMRVATECVRTTTVYVGVLVIIMFVFSIGVVRSFFYHPHAVMQVLLVAVAISYTIHMLTKMFRNRNHYRMLYQERVFPNINDDSRALIPVDKCPSTDEDRGDVDSSADEDADTAAACAAAEEQTTAQTNCENRYRGQKVIAIKSDCKTGACVNAGGPDSSGEFASDCPAAGLDGWTCCVSMD